MSLAKDLEIYKAADQLLALSLRLQVQVPRAYRQAVGMRISNECADILLTVARANAARGQSREQHIHTLLERLQDISRGDAMAEGCPHQNMAHGDDPRKWYADLWNDINGPGSWDKNPWVWVIEFKVAKP